MIERSTVPSRFYLSAAHKSSGKTTLSIGLAAALSSRGYHTQCFKKGPDYIDPLWLAKASGRPTYNLDFNTQSADEITTTFNQHASMADVSFIEGNKGLYDGVAVDGSNANSALAKLLNLPVVLVINCQGISRGIAPLLLGYQQFDTDIEFAGVILNQVGGSRHESKLIQAVTQYTDFDVLGCVSHDPELIIPERHLGLVPANESDQAQKIIDYLATKTAASVDLARLLDNCKNTTELSAVELSKPPEITRPLRIGIARDAAFGFYYPDDLDRMQQAGAELVFFDCLRDATLPEVDGLFIGGGFPETHMQELSENHGMRQSIYQAIENGMPAYAECGGMMYLCESIEWHGEQLPMVGLLDATISMHNRPQGRGYARYVETEAMPWSGRSELELNAHEFHYAHMTPRSRMRFAYSIGRGYGIDGTSDGVIYKNLIASFLHLRHTQSNPWVDRFLAFVQQVRS